MILHPRLELYIIVNPIPEINSISLTLGNLETWKILNYQLSMMFS